jgi:hypothetical protein
MLLVGCIRQYMLLLKTGLIQIAWILNYTWISFFLEFTI